jgi:hypothetical protein
MKRQDLVNESRAKQYLPPYRQKGGHSMAFTRLCPPEGPSAKGYLENLSKEKKHVSFIERHQKSMKCMMLDINGHFIAIGQTLSRRDFRCPSMRMTCRLSFKDLPTVSVSPGIEPGYIVFPSHKNNVYMLQ